MFNLSQSISKTISRIQQAAAIYEEIYNFSLKFSDCVIHLNNTSFVERAIECFGPCLSSKNAKIYLKTIYDVAFHQKKRNFDHR